ncbi:hypothetical protein ABT086_37225, partial [Streptomyces mirabilis]
PAHAHGNLDEYERLLRNLVDNAARHAAHRIRRARRTGRPGPRRRSTAYGDAVAGRPGDG